MITKTTEHDINRAGKRLLRDVLEGDPLGWVINDVQEDYGIDSNVQVFDRKCPTGAWFHVQLKSSASSRHSSDRTFISQELAIDHARHFATEMREPILLIHADVESEKLYWYAPQLDGTLKAEIAKTDAKSVTLRISTCYQLPESAAELLTSLGQIRLVAAIRELTSAPMLGFAEALKHFPNQAALFEAFQEKNDTLKLQNIRKLYLEKKFDEARVRAAAILNDPDSAIEVKFWAEVQLEYIDDRDTLFAGKPQIELAKLGLVHAEALRKLTESGPKHLKFYALIAFHAAELDILTHENSASFAALTQHLYRYNNPLMALGLFAQRAVLTKRIISKYNQCLRLARYASDYQNRWALGRALTRIVSAISPYLITLRWENNVDTELAFATSALQICKLAAWISSETGDSEGVVLAILSALMTTQSTDSVAYRWAIEAVRNVRDQGLREDALRRIERAEQRWKGIRVEGDYHGDTPWQIVQNMATALGVDISDENDPLVRGLRIAARANSPERVLKTCEHVVVTLGARGPIARRIRQEFNLPTAASKVVHCALHDYHVEGKELDSAYSEFKRKYCESCPDKKLRPEGWRLTDEETRSIEARHDEFVRRFVGGPYGLRDTEED